MSFTIGCFLPDIHRIEEEDPSAKGDQVFLLLKRTDLRSTLILFTIFMLGTSFNSTFLEFI